MNPGSPYGYIDVSDTFCYLMLETKRSNRSPTPQICYQHTSSLTPCHQHRCSCETTLGRLRIWELFDKGELNFINCKILTLYQNLKAKMNVRTMNIFKKGTTESLIKVNSSNQAKIFYYKAWESSMGI